MAGVGLKLLIPWPLKLFVDYVLVDSKLPESVIWFQALPGANTAQGLLGWLAAATVALFLTRRLVSIGRGYVKAGTGSRMVYALATDLFQHLQNRSLVFHGKQRVGDLVKRVTADCGCVRDLVMNVYLPVMTSLVTLVSMFAVMWHLSPFVALFAVGLAAPLGLVTSVFARPMSERRYREQELQGEVMALAEQTLTALPIVQAFGREEEEDRRFRGLARRTVQARLRTWVSQQQFILSTGALTATAKAVVMAVGGLAVLKGSMTVGSLLVLMAYFAALFSPVETLAYLGTGFASAAAGARRVLEILETGEECVREAPGARPLSAPRGSRRGHIRLERVTFGYDPERPVLHDVSLEAHPGEVIALVGRTGVGKSTLVSLIARLYDPWTGTVWFDDADVRNVQLRSLRLSIAIVLQDPFLLPLTVAENIAYGRTTASRNEVVAAARAANADDFIQKMPEGYETVIGERGVTLSGGEKQRLSIARALL